MKLIGILIDSTATLDLNLIKKHNIRVLHNSVNDDDGNIIVDKCTDEQKSQLCDLVVKEKRAIRTSSVNSQLIEDEFQSMLKEYEKIIYLSLAPSFSGQYNNALAAKTNIGSNNIIVLHSCSIAVQTEIVLNWLLEHIKQTKNLDQDSMQAHINEMDKHITTMFTSCTFDGMMVTGRIPAAVAKLLKLAKMFPIIQAEETNKKERLYRKWTEAIPNVLDAVDKRFNKAPRGKDIKELYLCHSLCSPERVEELKEEMSKHFEYDKNKILVRVTPLAVLATTLKDSFGFAIYTADDIVKK